MSDTPFGEFPKSSPLTGHFEREYCLVTKWFPNYIEELPQALAGVSIEWKKCNFVKDAQINVPGSFGVYCFTTDIGGLFPSDTKTMLLYIGKASEQYLSERFEDYLKEANNSSGREKVVNVLRKYKPLLRFWWCELPPIHVEVVERHLLMCFHPPANTYIPDKKKHWGKAFVVGES
jgi:hypothetical protein